MSLQPLRTLFFEDLSVGVTEFGIAQNYVGSSRRGANP